MKKSSLLLASMAILALVTACEKSSSKDEEIQAKFKANQEQHLLAQAGGDKKKLKVLLKERDQKELLSKVTPYGGGRSKTYYFSYSSSDRGSFGEALAAFSERNPNERIMSVTGDSNEVQSTGGINNSHSYTNVSKHAGYWVVTEVIDFKPPPPPAIEK